MTLSQPNLVVSQFGIIEAGRGIAATLVVLFHASGSIFAAPKYWNAHVFGGIFDFGYAGVEFFFVLSGFIIAHAHSRDIGQPTQLLRYLRRRVVRIYPMYWLVLAVVLTLATVGVGTGGLRTGVIASSILLAGPDSTPTVLAVAWTLYHEIAFYIVFALWIWHPRVGGGVTAAWLVTVALHAGGIDLGVAPYVSSSLNLLFLLGIGAAAMSRRRISGAVPLAILGAVAFIAIGLETVYLQVLPESLRQLAFGVACAAGITGVVAHERRYVVAIPAVLRALGAASYSIYLVHFPVLSVIAKISSRMGLIGRVPTQLAFFLVVVITLLLGYAVHRIIERPLLDRLQARRSTKSVDRSLLPHL